MPPRKRFYARVEPAFVLHDPRFNTLSLHEQMAYIRLWCLAVELRSDVLRGLEDNSTRVRSLLGIPSNTLRALVAKGSAMVPPLFARTSEGHLTICGVTKIHTFIGPPNGPYQYQYQDQEQEHDSRPLIGADEHPPSAAPLGKNSQSPPTPKTHRKWDGRTGLNIPDIIYRDDRAQIEAVLAKQPHLIPSFNANGRLAGFASHAD